MTKREQIGEQLFKEGYNCSQAVIGAFEDVLPLDSQTIYKLTAPFGAGMGRLREVCGAVSAMFMVLGLKENDEDLTNPIKKKETYEKVQDMSELFKMENGSIICKELLGLSEKNFDPSPEKRTEEYYKKRPCVEMVKSAIRIIEEKIL